MEDTENESVGGSVHEAVLLIETSLENDGLSEKLELRDEVNDKLRDSETSTESEEVCDGEPLGDCEFVLVNVCVLETEGSLVGDGESVSDRVDESSDVVDADCEGESDIEGDCESESECDSDGSNDSVPLRDSLTSKLGDLD